MGVAYSITGAYQMHNTIESINGLRWYYGFGGGFHTYKYKAAYTALGDYIGKNSISIFGQLGLDYKFEDKPIDVSLDWSPTFYFGSTTYLHGYSSSAGGLSLRYVIN
ncbi:MAG: hypothetical protein KBA06_03295 [Saprospiraceae bacterium]|nr:hypothetical protein [Saprospiraceae bacterium]